VSTEATSCWVVRKKRSIHRKKYTYKIPNQRSVGCADWIESHTDWFDIWGVAWHKFSPSPLLYFRQVFFYFRQKLLPVFHSRREDRPVQPFHKVVSMHQRHGNEIEPSRKSVRAHQTNAFSDKLLALFSCEHRVLGSLRMTNVGWG
jgi:hypothetical protein